jgi:TolB-like protein/Tfp pilus assembly protein PilF
VEPGLRRITAPDGAMRVEPRAMDVLVALARRAGETVSRTSLIDAVWKHRHVSDEALSRCISIVRKALGDDAGQARLLVTIPKRGYRLATPIEIDPASDDDEMPLAVLPFLNFAGDPDDEHVADGITELLISNLSCIPPLRVISRTSSMHYKRSSVRLTEIARELGVTRIVEGSVLSSHRQLQVVVQLIDATTDMHLFTRTYTRDLGDLLRLQNEIAWAVAEELIANLVPSARERLPQAPPIRHDAIQTYLRARHFWAQRTADGFAKAKREYEACIAAEPNFAAAHAGLADTFVVMALYGVAPPITLSAQARECAERALALDESSAEALTACGGVAVFFDWNLEVGANLFRRALNANPGHDIARLGLGDALMFRRDFDAGLRELHAAMRMNPLDLGLSMNLGEFLIWARRYDEASAAFEQTLDMGPHFWPARARLAELRALLGDREGAERELEAARREALPDQMLPREAFVRAVFGEHAITRKILETLEAMRAQRYISPGELARSYAMIGDTDAALRWIDVGIAERSPQMLMLDINVGYDPIRDDPRFCDRRARIGLS